MRAVAVGGLRAGELLEGPRGADFDGAFIRVPTRKYHNVPVFDMNCLPEATLQIEAVPYILRKFSVAGQRANCLSYWFWVYAPLAELGPYEFLNELFGNYRPVTITSQDR